MPERKYLALPVDAWYQDGGHELTFLRTSPHRGLDVFFRIVKSRQPRPIPIFGNIDDGPRAPTIHIVIFFYYFAGYVERRHVFLAHRLVGHYISVVLALTVHLVGPDAVACKRKEITCESRVKLRSFSPTSN